MLFKTAVVLSLAAIPFVAAQATEAQIENVEAHFTNAQIVADYLTDFEPSALLDLTFEGVGEVEIGQELTAEQAGPQPIVTVTPEGDDALNGTYTIAMIDVDFVGAPLDAGVTRHWLVNGATVGADGAVSIEGGNAVTPYGGPGPAEGSGAHRYVVVLYEEPAGFTPPAEFAGPLPIAAMDWNGYAANLGDLVAANYIQVENGVFTGSAVPTSSVGAAPTGGASTTDSDDDDTAVPTGSPSGSGSGSGTRPSGPASSGNAGSGAGKAAWSLSAAALAGAAAFFAL